MDSPKKCLDDGAIRYTAEAEARCDAMIWMGTLSQVAPRLSSALAITRKT